MDIGLTDPKSAEILVTNKFFREQYETKRVRKDLRHIVPQDNMI